MKLSNQKTGSAASHVRYLARESAQTHNLGVEPTFGTCGSDSFSRPLPGEKRVFKLVLSPQEFFSLDTRLYVHGIMAEFLQRAGVWESGQFADWHAYTHTNTENPHIHVLIHGVTREGKDLYFQPGVVRAASVLATKIQDRMTGWFPVSADLAGERRRTREYDRMPNFDGASLDDLIQRNSGFADWSRMLEQVPFFRRRALHQRMVFLENHDLIRQNDDGVITVNPNLGEQLAILRRGLGLVKERAKLRCLAAPAFELAHFRSPVAFGLVTPVIEIGPQRFRYTVLETTKDSAIAIRVPDELVDQVNELARSRALVRLKNGKPERFSGDAHRLIRTALHSTGAVAREVLSRPQTPPLELQSAPKKPPLQRSQDGPGY